MLKTTDMNRIITLTVICLLLFTCAKETIQPDNQAFQTDEQKAAFLRLMLQRNDGDRSFTYRSKGEPGKIHDVRVQIGILAAVLTTGV